MRRQKFTPIALLAVLLAGLLPVQPALTAPFAASRRLAQRPNSQQTSARSLVKQGIEQLRNGIETKKLKLLNAAAQMFQQAIVSAQRQNDRAGEALAQVSLGSVFVSLIRPKPAEDACQRSLKLYQTLADPSGEALSRLCLGGAYAFSRQPQKAREAFQNALALYQQLNHSYGEAASNLALGSSYLIAVQPQQARESFQQSLTLYRRLGDPIGEAYAVLNVGSSYLIEKKLEQSIPFYEQAREKFHQINQPSGELMTLFFMSIAYIRQKDWLKMIEVSEEIQALLAQGNTSLEANAENLFAAGASLGITRLLLEQYDRTSDRTHPLGPKTLQKAEVPNFREVVASQEGVGSAEFTNNLGRAYAITGQYQKAIDSFQKALEIYQTTSDRLGQFQATLNLAQVYSLIGQYQQALERAKQAVTLSREIERPYEIALSLYHLGQLQVLISLQDNDRTVEEKAIAAFEESLNIFQTLDKASEESMVFGVLGGVYILQERYQEGTSLIQQSLDSARKRSDPLEEVTATSNLGFAYLAQRQYPQAIALFRDALRIRQTIQHLHDRLDLASLPGIMGIALFQAGQLDEAEQYLRESIQLWRLGRQPLQDLNKVSFFEVQLQHLYDLLQRILIAKGNPEAALEVAEQGRARAFVELLAARWGQAEEAPASVEAPDLSEIRRIAREQNATLVTYSIAHDFEIRKGWPLKEALLSIWVVQPTGELILRQVDLQTLEKPLKELIAETRQYMIGASNGPAQADALPFPSGNPERDRFPIKFGLQRLHTLLIDPIADVLPTDPEARVVFVPHQDLFLVPFAALQDNQGRFLIQKHTLWTVPAIQVLAETRKRKAVLPSQGQDILVVGNPSPMPQKLSNLPGSTREATEIASLLKTEPILGLHATEAAVKKRLLGVRAIHLATHGTFNDREPLQGFLALAPSGQEDGLLTADEIYNLDNQLTAELVVLSGCDTGRGQINGDGVVGLARSWFSAGVPSAIVSLWQVPDEEATPLLMTGFYHRWQQGQDKAQALRQSMLAMMQKYPEPADWAAFTLIGEVE